MARDPYLGEKVMYVFVVYGVKCVMVRDLQNTFFWIFLDFFGKVGGFFGKDGSEIGFFCVFRRSVGREIGFPGAPELRLRLSVSLRFGFVLQLLDARFLIYWNWVCFAYFRLSHFAV